MILSQYLSRYFSRYLHENFMDHSHTFPSTSSNNTFLVLSWYFLSAFLVISQYFPGTFPVLSLHINSSFLVHSWTFPLLSLRPCQSGHLPPHYLILFHYNNILPVTGSGGEHDIWSWSFPTVKNSKNHNSPSSHLSFCSIKCVLQMFGCFNTKPFTNHCESWIFRPLMLHNQIIQQILCNVFIHPPSSFLLLHLPTIPQFPPNRSSFILPSIS